MAAEISAIQIKIIDVITSRLLLIFPDNFQKYYISRNFTILMSVTCMGTLDCKFIHNTLVYLLGGESTILFEPWLLL